MARFRVGEEVVTVSRQSRWADLETAERFADREARIVAIFDGAELGEPADPRTPYYRLDIAPENFMFCEQALRPKPKPGTWAIDAVREVCKPNPALLPTHDPRRTFDGVNFVISQTVPDDTVSA